MWNSIVNQLMQIQKSTIFVLAIPFLCLTDTAEPAFDHLDGTSWQLVRFQAGDTTTINLVEKTKYTLAFAADGSVSARIDCKQGRGTWAITGSKSNPLQPDDSIGCHMPSDPTLPPHS